MSGQTKQNIGWVLATIGVLLVLIALGFMAMGVQARKDVEEAKEKLRAQGAPMNPSDVFVPPVAEEENARQLLMEAKAYKEANDAEFETLEEAFWDADIELDEDPRAIKDYSTERVAALKAMVAFPLTEKYLAMADKALERPYFWYDLRGMKGMEFINMMIPEVGVLMEAARYYSYRLQVHAMEGNIDACLNDGQKIFQLADLSVQHPSLINGLTTIAIQGVGLWQVMLLTNSEALNNAQLLALKDILPQELMMSRFIEAMDSERVLFAESAWNEIRAELWSFFDNGNHFSNFWGMDSDAETLLYLYVPGRIDKDHAAYLEYTLVLRAELLPAEAFNYEHFKNTEDTLRKSHEFGMLSDMLMPTYVTVVDHYLITDAQVAITRTGLSLLIYHNDHGAYPDSLDALVPEYIAAVPIDPFTGEPLVYRRVDEGFQLYSLGPNLTDDGGYWESDDAKAYDLVWWGRGGVLPEAPVE